MQYDTGKHSVFDHGYDIAWSTKYRYKVLTGALRLQVRDIFRQVCRENEVDILPGVLSSDHVHIFMSVPPNLAISDLVRMVKGRSSYQVQHEFRVSRRSWGCRFWGRVFALSLGSMAFKGSHFNRQGRQPLPGGALRSNDPKGTEDIVLQYLEHRIADPTGASF